jgi:hypothetical protein
MSNLKVTTVNLTQPITIVGKIFTGDYAKSQQFTMEVQKILKDSSVEFIPNKVMGVYYDNPAAKKPEDLKSFQGVFIKNNIVIPAELEKLQLKGNYIYVKAFGDIMKAIRACYEALFNHIAENKVNLKSPAGYQISTFDNGNFITEIYMETT